MTIKIGIYKQISHSIMDPRPQTIRKTAHLSGEQVIMEMLEQALISQWLWAFVQGFLISQLITIVLSVILLRWLFLEDKTNPITSSAITDTVPPSSSSSSSSADKRFLNLPSWLLFSAWTTNNASKLSKNTVTSKRKADWFW